MSDNYENPKEGKTYISPGLPAFRNPGQKVRIASKVISSPETYAFAQVKDEIVLRHREGGKAYIKAKFLEDNRNIFLLSIQGYSVATNKPHNASFAFVGDEITKLLEFIQNIKTYEFKNNGRVNIADNVLRSVVLSQIQAKELFHANQEVLTELLRSEVTKEDIVALGYRKKQIEVFKRLIVDSRFFEELKSKKTTTDEGLWQSFFEKNTWIFGYGLDFVFLSSLDGKKLEQLVEGYSLSTHGKRVDALMKTRGAISSLCFTEIKHHKTPLLEKQPYRAGCWAPSRELTGAVAQIQGTVAAGVENLRARFLPTSENGQPTGEDLFNVQPRSFLVIGNLSEFMTEPGINEDQFKSFERYRRNILSPEIVTFDELYDRASFIVAKNIDQV